MKSKLSTTTDSPTSTAAGAAAGATERRPSQQQDRVGNAALQGRLSGGDALPERVKAGVENATGGDLSDARVHRGADAKDAAGGLGAKAVTVGNDIMVGDGGDSDKVLAHEAAHVLQQQAGGGATAQTKLSVGEAGGAHEMEADRVADAAMGGGEGGGGKATITPAGPAAQRLPSPEMAAAVRRDIDTWYDTQVDYADATRRWQSLNYTQYLSATGGNFFLSWTEGQMMNIIANLVGEVAGLLAPVVAGAIIGSAVAPGVGTAIGAIVGFLVGAVWGAISQAISNRETEEAVDKALRGTGAQIQANENQFSDKSQQARGNARQIRDFMKGLVENPEHTDADIQSWRTFVQGETRTLRNNPAPASSNRDLADDMLREWVLQHAGDEEDNNKETNSAAWDANRAQYFGADADLDGHPEIFAKQSKYEFGKIGVPHQTTTAGWERELATGPLTANEAQSNFQGRETTFRSTSNPEGFIKYIDANLPMGMSLAAEGKENIRNNQFRLKPKLDLSKSDGSVYVNEWEYSFDLTGPLPQNLARHADFDVSPD